MARAHGFTIVTKLLKLVTLLVITGVLIVGVLVPYVGGSGLLARTAANKFLDTTCNFVADTLPQTSTMYASDGKTIITQFYSQNRSIVSINQIPHVVQNALIAVEDKRFLDHHGVDIKGLIRAALHTSKGSTQGGSTLTEQYVKQVRYYNAVVKGDQAAAEAAINQNINRKIIDAKCALAIEKKYSKTQILEKYLNIAYFGENAYGIQRAAQIYFGKDVSKLNPAEGALIVGLVKAPGDLDPFTSADSMDKARQRRDLVLDNMADQKYITVAQATAYKALPVKLGHRSDRQSGCYSPNGAINNVGFFCDYALRWLTSKTGGGLTQDQIDTGGLNIVTTLDANLQNQGQAAIAPMGLDQNNDYLLAMPSIDPRTGAVTSMITDKIWGNPTKPGDNTHTVNPIFTSAYAGSGSTYKYFTALAALKAGVPLDFKLTTPNNKYTVKNCPPTPGTETYAPTNAGNYRSTLPLSQALPESSNTYFVAMEDELFGCNLSPIVNTAIGLGMTRLTEPDPNNSARTLGQSVISEHRATFTLGNEPTSALQLTGAFAALANDGVFYAPNPISKITDTTGSPVDFKRVTPTRQFSPFIARTLLSIMVNDTLPGQGGTAQKYFANYYSNGGYARPIAAKTGTDNDSVCTDPSDQRTCKDDGQNSALWFVGVTPTLVSAAALVNPKNPKQSIAGIPGITGLNDNGLETFGAFSSTFWQAAYLPQVQAQPPWTWPTVQGLPGNQVPYLKYKSPQDAVAAVEAAGLKAHVITSYACGSSVYQGNVAYYTPTVAAPGDTITMCLSSGVAPVVEQARPKPPVTKPPAAAPAVPAAPATPH